MVLYFPFNLPKFTGQKAHHRGHQHLREAFPKEPFRHMAMGHFFLITVLLHFSFYQSRVFQVPFPAIKTERIKTPYCTLLKSPRSAFQKGYNRREPSEKRIPKGFDSQPYTQSQNDLVVFVVGKKAPERRKSRKIPLKLSNNPKEPFEKGSFDLEKSSLLAAVISCSKHLYMFLRVISLLSLPPKGL